MGDDPSGARILVREVAVLEGALLGIVISIFVWEYWISSRRNARQPTKQVARTDTLQLWTVSILVSFVSACVILAGLAVLDSAHALSVLQRGLFILLTVCLVPSLFLLMNPELKPGSTPFLAFVFSLVLYAGFEVLITFLSSLGDEFAFFARLNDVYVWNQMFPGLARSELWLTIYMPWLLWYLLMYVLINFSLFVLLFLRTRFVVRRNK